MLIVQYKWHTFAYFYWTVVLWEWTSLWFVQCYAAYGQVFFISGLHSSCGCMTLIFYWTLQVDNANCYECLHITGEFISKQVQLELSIPLILCIVSIFFVQYSLHITLLKITWASTAGLLSLQMMLLACIVVWPCHHLQGILNV